MCFTKVPYFYEQMIISRQLERSLSSMFFYGGEGWGEEERTLHFTLSLWKHIPLFLYPP